MEVTINYLAVLIAAIASMGLGFLWYSQYLFGKQWAALKGFTDESLKAAQKSMGPLYALSFVLALLTSYLLVHVMNLSQSFYGNTPLQAGIASAFFMWLGFVMPTQVTAQIFGEKKWKLFGIDTGYQLAWMLLAGLIIGLMA